MKENYMTDFMIFYDDKKTYNIEKIIFKSMDNAEIKRRCESSLSFHDVTDKNKGGKVTAWIEEENEVQTLYVASDGLTKLPIDSSWLFAVFSKREFNYNLFYYVKSIDFQNVDTSEVRDMSKMFSGLKNLEQINLKSFDTRNVQTMACMFLGCLCLNNLDLSCFKIDNLECVIEMFYGCSSLKFLNIENFSFKQLSLISEFDTDEVFLELPTNIKIKIKDNQVMQYILNLKKRARPLKWNENNFLIVNGGLVKNINRLLKENISLVASNVGAGKFEFIINTLFELGIKNSKKIIMFNYDGPSDFYVSSLLSLISNIDKSIIDGYLKPCLISSKKTPKIDETLFMKALEQIKFSKIIICDGTNLLLSIDPVDYILEYDEDKNTDLLIINYFNELVKISKYSLEEILQKLDIFAKENKTHILLSYNQSIKKELKYDKDLEFIEVFKKYLKNIIIMSYCDKQDEKNYKQFWLYEVENNTMSIMKSI